MSFITDVGSGDSAREDVTGTGELRQSLARPGCQDEQSPPGLKDSVVSSLQDRKSHLVEHPGQSCQTQPQHQSSFILDHVLDVLQQEEQWSVEVAV